RSTRAAKVAASEDLPPQLRGVRVVRDGKVVHGAAPKGLDNAERAGNATVKEGAAVRTQEREIRVGDRVRLSTFGSVGIVDQIKGTEAQVRVGSLHLREKLMNLELIDDTQGSSSNLKEGSLEQMQRRASIELHLHSKESDSKFQSHSELNLIGKKTDEAVDLADKFLDEAFLNGMSEVRIIHGHG